MKRGTRMLLLLCGSLASCAPPPAVLARPLSDRARVDATGTQVIVSLGAAPEKVTPRVVQLFVDNAWSVGGAQSGIVEAKLPREIGLIAQYDMTVRAYVLPDGTGTRVTLYGEETGYIGSNGPNVVRVNDRSRGRAAATWKTLQQIAIELSADSTLR